MARELWRSASGVAALAALAALSAIRCINTSDPLSSRVGALERRLTALEQAQQVTGDGQPDAATESLDASLDSLAETASGGAPGGESVDHSCSDQVSRTCQRALRSPQQNRAESEAELSWYRVPALDSPEGRRCQRELRERCEAEERYNREQRELYAERQQAFFRWLDGQLTADKIDEQLSAELESKIGRALRDAGEAQPKVQVRCVPQFCRVQLEIDPKRDDLRSAALQPVDWRQGGNGYQDRQNPRRFVTYATRPGWVMPEAPNLSQRGQKPGFRRKR